MRIQILPLPSAVKGDDVEKPFALIFDQIEDGINKELLYEFARQCGSRTHVMLPQTVEIVDRYAEPPKTEPDEMTIREEEIGGIPVVVIPEKALGMLKALGWTPPADGPRQNGSEFHARAEVERLADYLRTNYADEMAADDRDAEISPVDVAMRLLGEGLPESD